MSIYFTSGQICKLFNISKQTLLFYDKIDLIKPSYINPNTLYRYYSIEQFPYLYIILALKTSGIELKDIKNHLAEHSIPKTMNLLNSQIKNLNDKIAELEIAKKTLNETLTQIKYGTDFTETNPFYYTYFEEEYLYTFPIEEMDNTKDFSLTFSKLINEFNTDYSSMKWRYGWIVSLKPNGEFKNRDLFIELDKPINNPHLIIKPAGEYLCTFHKGSYQTLEKTRHALLKYASENSLPIRGYIYERQLINTFITNTVSEFITEISIGI